MATASLPIWVVVVAACVVLAMILNNPAGRRRLFGVIFALLVMGLFFVPLFTRMAGHRSRISQVSRVEPVPVPRHQGAFSLPDLPELPEMEVLPEFVGSQVIITENGETFVLCSTLKPGQHASQAAWQQDEAEPGVTEEPTDDLAASEPSEDGALRPRPNWVDEASFATDQTFRLKVSCGPYSTIEECNQALPDALHDALAAYLKEHVGADAANLVHVPEAFIRERLIEDRYDELVRFQVSPSQVAPMVKSHVLLSIDSRDHDDLARLWREKALVGRAGLVATGGGLVLLLLATLYGYLRLDTATKGYYSGRLKLLACGMAMAGTAASVVAIRFLR